MAMTDAQVLMAQGRREGRTEAQREMLILQLEHKFGSLSDEVKSRIAALTQRKMRDIATRLLEAQSLAELNL